MLSAIQLTVGDNGGADASANDDIHHAPLAPASAVIELAQSGRLGIVLQAHR
jgi:hypothetical protein